MVSKKKKLFDRHWDFGPSGKTCLKKIMKFNLSSDFAREELELICYIICTQSGHNGSGKSHYDKNQIKCKTREKVKHDL
jgi:hypothetical protein